MLPDKKSEFWTLLRGITREYVVSVLQESLRSLDLFFFNEVNRKDHNNIHHLMAGIDLYFAGHGGYGPPTPGNPPSHKSPYPPVLEEFVGQCIGLLKVLRGPDWSPEDRCESDLVTFSTSPLKYLDMILDSLDTLLVEHTRTTGLSSPEGIDLPDWSWYPEKSYRWKQGNLGHFLPVVRLGNKPHFCAWHSCCRIATWAVSDMDSEKMDKIHGTDQYDTWLCDEHYQASPTKEFYGSFEGSSVLRRDDLTRYRVPFSDLPRWRRIRGQHQTPETIEERRDRLMGGIMAVILSSGPLSHPSGKSVIESCGRLGGPTPEDLRSLCKDLTKMGYPVQIEGDHLVMGNSPHGSS